MVREHWGESDGAKLAGLGGTLREAEGATRAAANAVAAAARAVRRGRSGVAGFQLGQVGQEFVLFGQAAEVVADHLVGA